MAAKDKELEAITSIIDLLTPLDELERSRVIEYVLKRLAMGAVQAAPTVASAEPSSSSGRGAIYSEKDIRTLTAEKQPRSANEMVALVAYYISELAPEGEASRTINADIIRRYFKMAGFPLPSSTKNALTNATAAGYLTNVSRGEYKLNPVGYNLIVHGLPRSSGSAPKKGLRIKRKRRRK